MPAILLAGFGGQGILFAGKQLVTTGMKNGMEVSWLPSYGPEMRGGTANCSVNIDNKPIGSPVVTCPDILIVMNLPSLDKFEAKVKANGTIVLDSSLINRKITRQDVRAFYIPASKIADDEGLTGLANVIMLGQAVKQTALFDFDVFCAELQSSAPKSKPQLGELNVRAFTLGYEYK